MRKTNVFRIDFLFCFFILTVTLYSRDIIHLWPGQVPGESKPKAKAIVSHRNERNVKRLSEVTDPILEVYTPDKDKHNGAAVVVCPGGGYWILAVDLEGYEVARWLADLGYTAFVLQYRVPDKRDQALMDAQRAIRIVRSKSQEYMLDPEKTGIMGFSAGGSLSARTSTLYDSTTYSPVDKLDDLSCRPDFAALIYPAYLDQGENRSLTPELKVNDQTPPMYLFATADDKYGNSALVMTGALCDAGVPVELHFLPDGGHGYGLRKGKRAAEAWPEMFAKWLDEYMLSKGFSLN